jgi:oxygen-independent coproporphyrinogen-3 oxidase
MTSEADYRGFGLYIHWPFCLKKCPYCDFNSHVRTDIEQLRWRNALLSELNHVAALTEGRTLHSVFFGGGTPSLMPAGTVSALLNRIATRWRLAPDIEITLEANPTSVEAERFRSFADAGVNRVSLGIQALDDAALRFLGRAHSADEARRAIGLAAEHFGRYSFDLIYARPGQTLAAWDAELDQALTLAGEHLSVYQLTIEPGTAFHTEHARGGFILPDDDTGGALYELTQARLRDAGLAGYEISNHARPGAESRHNLTYWRYGDYAGIGPGAHGRLTLDGVKTALRQKKAPETWLDSVERDGHGTEEQLALTPAERAEEMLMMGLRLTEGIPLSRFIDELGSFPEDWLDPTGLEAMIEGGFVTLDAARLTATGPGRQRLNAVLGRLVR